MGCETPDLVQVFARERVIVKASGGPGPAGSEGPPGPQGVQGQQGPIGPQGLAGDNNIVAQGPLSYDPATGDLSLNPGLTLNGGNF